MAAPSTSIVPSVVAAVALGSRLKAQSMVSVSVDVFLLNFTFT
jgi:hypothetical protein